MGRGDVHGGDEYTLLTAAGGVTGTFGTLTQGGASIGLLTPEVTYQANAVELTLEPGACTGPDPLDCEVPPGGTLPWATQITAATLDLNTQNPNSGTMVLSNGRRTSRRRPT